MWRTRARRKPCVVIVLDLEATCERVGRPVPQEVIELSAVVVDVSAHTQIGSIQCYVRPTVHPRLSEFCTELTGISQETVDAADAFPEALGRFERWLADYSDDAVFLTSGAWDLAVALPTQAAISGVALHPRFQRWLDIQEEFHALYRCPAHGLRGMMATLRITPQGRAHSGLVDCRNTARVAIRMLRDGWRVPGLGWRARARIRCSSSSSTA